MGFLNCYVGGNNCKRGQIVLKLTAELAGQRADTAAI